MMDVQCLHYTYTYINPYSIIFNVYHINPHQSTSILINPHQSTSIHMHGYIMIVTCWICKLGNCGQQKKWTGWFQPMERKHILITALERRMQSMMKLSSVFLKSEVSQTLEMETLMQQFCYVSGFLIMISSSAEWCLWFWRVSLWNHRWFGRLLRAFSISRCFFSIP